MNSSIKKATKRRGRRVATVFIGAAACTAAFAPAAMAGTGDVARLNTPANNPHLWSGNIKSGGCANVPNWVHIQAMYNDGHPFQRRMRCFGNRGDLEVSDGQSHGPMITYYECGGNNWGFLIGLSTLLDQSYGPGTSYRKEWTGPATNPVGFAVNSVYNRDWSGTDTCPANAS
jgi:hypothetical protein